MKFFRILAPAVLTACLTVTTAFASPVITNLPGNDKPQQCEEFKQDPIKMLECKKEKVQTLLKEGKITKEEADAITARIDTKIKQLNEFNKLSVQQKKDKLINDFKTSVNNRVKEGKLTKEEADSMINDFTEKVTKWDGTGYPRFHGKEFKHKNK